MNLDILVSVIENTPEDDLALLLLLGRCCRTARRHAACVQATRRAGLLSHVRESREAVMLHASSGAGTGHFSTEATRRMSRAQRDLHDYLRNTYGLSRKFGAATPKNRVGSYLTAGASFRLRDAWVKRNPSHVHAGRLVSDLLFLARAGYATDISYYLRGEVSQQHMEAHLANPFVRLLHCTEGIQEMPCNWRTCTLFHIASR